ncbi:MAG: CCA tRNA nucleotidyltransferase [Planctomycetaceae bacterium]|nr:CCA tRNA nucleotidyltransferase [Planctomycetaceae bacterium]
MTNKQAAIQIIRSLRKEGFQALLAGGCVRDTLLGREPKDYDIATDARPEQICKIFRRTIRVGTKFGVIIVMMEGHQIEVATFRADTGYSDGRRPDNISFTSAENDALRRDFTINGMFFDPIKNEVLDFVGGQKDLKKKTIRTIGKADERFSEDYLRMLRAVRFAGQLDFKIEKSTLAAIKRYHSLITKISGERIAMELESLMAATKRIKGLKLFIETGLAKEIFPVLNDKINFGMKVFKYLPKEMTFELAVAGMFSGCESAEAMESLEVLKLSTSKLKHIDFLLIKRDFLNNELSLAELKTIVSQPYYADLYVFQTAVLKAERKGLAKLNVIAKRAKLLAGRDLQPKPLLNGHELMALGAKAGPQIGQISKELYVEQLSEDIATKEDAKRWVENWIKNHKS